MANYYIKLLCIPSELILVYFTITILCILNYGFYDCHFISVNWFRYFNRLIIIFSVLIFCISPPYRWPRVLPKHEGHCACQSILIYLCAFCWYCYHYIWYVLSYLNDFYFLLFFLNSFLAFYLSSYCWLRYHGLSQESWTVLYIRSTSNSMGPRGYRKPKGK
jgi:hypothetical protein